MVNKKEVNSEIIVPGKTYKFKQNHPPVVLFCVKIRQEQSYAVFSRGWNMQKKDILKRIVPMPRNIKISKGVTYEASRIKIEMPGERTPPLKTASNILGRFANPGQICPDFIISLRYINRTRDKAIYKKLKNIKNQEQSYAIKPIVEKGVYKSVELLAFNDIGLLYAAVTLSQAVVRNGEESYIPVLYITDWPEVAYRGQWGGNSHEDMGWTFQYKLNTIDGKVFVGTDKKGSAFIDHDQKLYDMAEGYGVGIVTTIPHLEGLSKKGFLDNKNDVLNVPSPERGSRSDYFPGLCMSKEATEDMIFGWMEELAKNSCVTKMLVWLSEEETRCYCDDCNGGEPYQLETACLLKVYNKLRRKFPDIECGIMLSQGSFKVTDKIAGMLPENVSLTYYDGGRTYDSGKYPMILPVLRKYVKKGGKLGVYPQVTHSWRTVFPWTAPAFIKYRCEEFVKVGLDRVIGYAVPSNRYHEFNVMAFAEWLWNPDGRKIDDFISSYAFLNGIDEAPFKKFINLMEKPAWQLAQSKIMLRLTYNYPLILRGRVELQDHRYEMSELIPIKNPRRLIKDTEKALDIAINMDENCLVYEASCVLAGLRAYMAITGFIKEIDKKSIDTSKLLRYFTSLKKAAKTMRKSIMQWSELAIMDGSVPMRRVIDTSMVLYRALDGFKRYFDETNVQIGDVRQTVHHLGEWDESAFDENGNGILEYDLTSYLLDNGKGRYYVSMDFVESASGTDINGITLVERQPGGGEKQLAFVRADLRRLSVWAPWIEYPLAVGKPGMFNQYILKVDVSGMDKDTKTCRGLAGIRKI